MNVKGLTRLLVAGVALAVLCSAMPAQAAYRYRWTDRWSGGTAGGIFYNTTVAEGQSVLFDVTGSTTTPIAKYSMCVDATVFAGSQPYDVTIEQIGWTETDTTKQEFKDRKVAWLVCNYMKQYAGDESKAGSLQKAVWSYRPNTGVASYDRLTGTDALANQLIDWADLYYTQYTGGAYWIKDNDPDGTLQMQVTCIPEAGVLSFAAFAGLGALAVLRRRTKS